MTFFFGFALLDIIVKSMNTAFSKSSYELREKLLLKTVLEFVNMNYLNSQTGNQVRVF